MLLWDVWGMQARHEGGPIPAADAALLDETCALTIDPGTSPDVLTELGQRDELRVPTAVTSFDPYGGPLRQVDVSRVLAP